MRPLMNVFFVPAAGAAIALSVVMLKGADDDLRIVHPVPAANPANPPAPPIQPHRIADNFELSLVAQGSDPIENPVGGITKFGLLTDGTHTEPDENLYLVFDHELSGPTAGYHYGRRFLFQGHENGGGRAYITRINLDVTDPNHRITLMTPADPTGFSSIDGSTWDPFTRTLLFTQEAGKNGGVIELTTTWPPAYRTLDGIIGRAGYEGIHPDNEGNLLILEDSSGAAVNVIRGDATSAKTAHQPNSFVYRFEPYQPWDLSAGGKLFALQASVDGAPVVFGPDAVADTFSDAQLHLHTPGTSWPAAWVLVHDTATDGTAAFDANALAKAAKATPFKRPENGQFQPGSRFQTFFFDATGDTDALAGAQPALAARGSWGAIFRVRFATGSHRGTLRIVVLGDKDHASFDNVAFTDAETLLAAEDRGDTLHDQLNALDSVWAFDVVDSDFGPRRLIALGRDPDSAPAGREDNEPTGLHVSDGSTSPFDVLGTFSPSDAPRRFPSGWDDDWLVRPDRGRDRQARWFVTAQHGLNQVFEILQRRR